MLHPRFAVRAMQSTDIFSVGGSISVNAHGMDHQAGALAKSIKSMRVMLADGTLRTVSPTENKELFDLVVGGYGLFGVIVEAELDIADNLVYQTGRRVMDYKEFPALFASEIEKDQNIGLMYGHLSTAPSTFLKELLLYTYTRVDGADFKREPLGEVSGTKLRRLTINLSKQGPLFQEMKWFSEKHIEHRMENCTVTRAQAIGSAEACLVNRNDPMHDSVPYLRNSLPDDTDILHEYFIPRSQFVSFVDGMRKVLTDNRTNLLNASVRIVHQEDEFPDLFAGAGVLAGALHQPAHRRRGQPSDEEGDGGADRPHHRPQGPVFPALPAVLFARPVAAVLSADQRFLRGEAQVRSGRDCSPIRSIRNTRREASPSCEERSDEAIRLGAETRRFARCG